MKAYCGQTRSRELIAALAKEGIGECTVRGELPPRRRPWFYDNGCYRDWVAAAEVATEPHAISYTGDGKGIFEIGPNGESVSSLRKAGSKFDPKSYVEGVMFNAGWHSRHFDMTQWDRDLRWMRDHHLFEKFPLPDFVVVPDVVGDAEESLRFSDLFVGDVPAFMPVYLAVQDGMEACMGEVLRRLKEYEGLFVGGTDAWKERTASRWVQLAHTWGAKCHIGRVGTPNKVHWAKSIGADSIDSSFPLWHQDHMQRWLTAIFAGDE